MRAALNKMTREGFEKLSNIICAVPLNSVTSLQDTVTLVFDKALELVSFADLYAELAVKLSNNWMQRQSEQANGAWSFVRPVRVIGMPEELADGAPEPGPAFWTTEDATDRPYKGAELCGPFSSAAEAVAAAVAPEGTAVAQPEDGEADFSLRVVDAAVCEGFYVRLLQRAGAKDGEEGAAQFFSEANPPTVDARREEGLPLEGTNTGEPHASAADALKQASRNTSFKRLLLNKCQEAFMQNVQDELAGVDDPLPGETRDQNERRRVARKGKVIGNIRYIGELYNKKMLQV